VGGSKFNRRFAAIAGSDRRNRSGERLDERERRPECAADVHAGAGGSKITKLPAGMRNKPVTVMVQLADEPVAAADAAAAQPLTATQKNQRRDKLRQEQAPVAQKARQLGGTVLGTYQHAYNGIKVRVNAGQLDALAAPRRGQRARAADRQTGQHQGRADDRRPDRVEHAGQVPR
jgi:hypothetical protein